MTLARTLIAALALAVSVAAAQAQTVVDGSDAAVPAADANLIKDTLFQYLLDPLSSQIAKLIVGKSERTYCGVINAKNRFGGYIGFVRFAIDFPRGRIFILSDTCGPDLPNDVIMQCYAARNWIPKLCP